MPTQIELEQDRGRATAVDWGEAEGRARRVAGDEGAVGEIISGH